MDSFFLSCSENDSNNANDQEIHSSTRNQRMRPILNVASWLYNRHKNGNRATILCVLMCQSYWYSYPVLRKNENRFLLDFVKFCGGGAMF
jgi:hypothetical protein